MFFRRVDNSYAELHLTWLWISRFFLIRSAIIHGVTEIDSKAYRFFIAVCFLLDPYEFIISYFAVFCAIYFIKPLRDALGKV